MKNNLSKNRRNKRLKIFICIISLLLGLSVNFFAVEDNNSSPYIINIELSNIHPQRGDTITATVTVTNTDSSRQTDITVIPPYFAAILGQHSWSGTLQTNEEISFDVQLHLLEGGHSPIQVIARSGDGSPTVKEQGVTVSGPGFYSGDNHTHSTITDGQGTMRENADYGFEKAYLSWIYATDHNSSSQTEPARQISDDYNGRFICLGGNEYSSKVWHIVTYNHDYALPVTSNLNNTEYGLDINNTQDYQDVIDTYNNLGGFVYLAHPYMVKAYDVMDYFMEHLRNFKGIEVWNASQEFAHERSMAHAMYAWDSLNSLGIAHYYGIASTDSHLIRDVGTVFIKGYLPSLNRDNIHDLMTNGRYFGSNGPEVRFDIDGVGIGETLNITSNQGEASFHFAVYDRNYKLTEVKIIKNTITGKYEQNNTVVYQKDLSGLNVNSYEETVRLPVRPGEFYRLHVTSESSALPRYRFLAPDSDPPVDEPGFAYTNNIWIDRATQSNSTPITSLTYDGDVGQMKSTQTGIRYIDCEGSAFNLSHLNVISPVNVKKTFDEETDVATITLTAQDGSKRVLDIYVLNYNGQVIQPPVEDDSDSDSSSDSDSGSAPETGDGLIQAVIIAAIGLLLFELLFIRKQRKYRTFR